jgi:hypothetical protein
VSVAECVCVAKADCSLLLLIYLMCSLNLVSSFRSICPTYALLQVWQTISYMPLCAYILLSSSLCCCVLSTLSRELLVLKETLRFVW